MSKQYRVIAEKAFIGNQLHEQGDIVDISGDFTFDKTRDGDILEPLSSAKGEKELEEQAKGDRTVTNAKISRDPRTDSGGTNDLA